MTSTDFLGGTGFHVEDIDLDDSLFDGPPDEYEPDGLLPDGPEFDPDADSLGQHGYSEPDASAVGGSGRRPRGAPAYEKKLRAIFAKAIKITAQRPATVADSATLLLYSPKAAQVGAELAVADPRIARAVDLLFEGTESPYLNAAVAFYPLFSQLARNHEPVLEPKLRGFRIPLTKRRIDLPFKVGVKLPWYLRVVTYEPRSVADHVFSNPAVQEAFRKQDIPIAWRPR